MEYPWGGFSVDDEPLASQYPDNVVEKFANAFSRQSPYDGPGYCWVSYSPQLTVVHCKSDINTYQPVVGAVMLVLLVRLGFAFLRMCCR
jgi:hypothetical protein